MNLDKNLRYYREQAGYKTAKEFADILNIPYNTYTAYENQKREPKLEMLIKIADLLNISLDDLVGRTPADEDERLKKVVSDLLSKYDNQQNIKIHEVEYIPDFEKYKDNTIMCFSICEKIYSSINKKNFIDKLNYIDLFTKNFKDKLSYYCFIRYLLYGESLFLNDDIERIEKALLSNESVTISNRTITDTEAHKLLEQIKKRHKNNKVYLRFINNSLKAEEIKAFLLIEEIIDVLKKIDTDINNELTKELDEYKKQEAKS